MNAINLDALIEKIEHCVERHKISTGCYSRWLAGRGKSFEKNEYGCADAANILYTIGKFPGNPDERKAWISHLQQMQNPETGLFQEATHHPIHTTAHCTAALELFDAKPLYRITALEKYTNKQGLQELLEKEVKWQEDPWAQSHKGAGILVCLTNADMVGLEWKNQYFDWFWEHSDPETGFFRCGSTEGIPLFRHMAGGFHYMFNHEAEHRPLRYPDRIIDSCLELMEHSKENGMLHSCGFADIDAVYSLTRAMRQTPHRFYEAKEALARYADEFVNMMLSLDDENDAGFNDLHRLFGAVCCLAELQSALKGKLITSRPMKLVLDRRPFI